MIQGKKFPVSLKVGAILDAVAEIGRPMIAGGAVRDWILGRESKDLDVEVFNCTWDRLIALLKRLGRVDLVGKSFGVAKFHICGLELDFALPRSELKTGDGHRGFDVVPDPFMDPRRAALRRDFTMNAISYDWKEKEIVDQLDGRKDLENLVLRHSSEAFSEDPLRVLRGFQFCSRFQLEAASETVCLCRNILNGFSEIARERVWMEWEKWAIHSVRPSLGLRFLLFTRWLEHFPEIWSLVDCPQDPEWHPEGDVFQHTCYCLDALAGSDSFKNANNSERLVLMFGVLCHDFGKTVSTEQKMKGGSLRWVSPRHDQEGVSLTEDFLRRIGAPLALIPKVQSLVSCHMAAIHIKMKPSLPQVRRLARRVAPASLKQLFAVMRADQGGRPPLPVGPTQSVIWLEEVAGEGSLLEKAPKPLVLGRHLMERGMVPGPHFKPILDELFELQLDGAFASLEDAVPFIDRLCKV